MANSFDYSQTPASNNGAPPDGSPEDCAPSTVNNTMRKMMANIAGAFNCYTAGGTANAQTVTLDPALTAYSTKVRIAFIPVADNTGACTLAVNGLTATSIKLVDGSDPHAGALDASGIAVVQYDGTNFVLLNPATLTGSYTGTLTGLTTSPTTTINYTRKGNVVRLKTAGDFGISNTTDFTITGAPSEITPATNSGTMFCILLNSGNRTRAEAYMNTSGTLEFSLSGDLSGFTSSGNKGFSTAHSFELSYLLNP